ncbi:hypothetical protein THAOC_35815 [Thalassiosira oceanica]|uniref:Pherophorin domain-containing protein n=1 Tax=Thalassiosira oceanica TaxID=159749 RepID=K0R2T9_THAOC|nr:hypothetical protein THAOC_35815 [Thalassiosira oceanica]|eukprot:EJK45564.1 hypothetical protein THAOC_35815 [Thalassiosira oceanica]
MTASTKLLLAATAALCLPACTVAMHRVRVTELGTIDEGRHLEVDENESRNLSHYTVVFEECIGVPLETCEALIAAEVAANPAIFEGRTSLQSEVKHVRTHDGSNYNVVAIRLDLHEEHVAGVYGDGIVYYPFDWCVAEDDCFSVGPWDCSDVHLARPMTFEQCCGLVKAHVPVADLNGNHIRCHPDPPIGSADAPIDYGRVQIRVNADNVVISPPMNF